MSTYTTFYTYGNDWTNNFNSTSSTSISSIYGFDHTYNLTFWDDIPKHEPKFSIGDTILYHTYMLQCNKLAIHTIVDIKDELYIFDSPYYLDEQYTMVPEDTDDKFMLLEEGLLKYPDVYLNSKRNGPEPGHIKEVLKKK